MSDVLAALPAEGRRPGASLDAHLWHAVDRLLDRVEVVPDVCAHRLELLKADRLRRLGLPIPPALVEEERSSILRSLAAPLLLERVRAACDGPVLLLKGPEVARWYPSPRLRAFDDVDVLVADAEGTQQSLVDAGFVEVGEPSHYVGIHHLRPLHLPGFPLVVEVHERPKWVTGLPPPSAEALFGVAEPAEGGLLALPAAALALVLAAHDWAHRPLEQLGRLVDIAAVCQGADRAEVRELAERWRVARLWRTTSGAIDALLYGTRPVWPLRTWARGLAAGRERTVLENHLERILAGYAVLPPRRAAAATAVGLRRTLTPYPGETWARKARRAREALGHARWRRSWHDRRLDGEQGSERPR